MIIDCISDLHGEFPKLGGGDLLIIAGDCTSNDSTPAWIDFAYWLNKQSYRKKVLVGGNHDNTLQQTDVPNFVLCSCAPTYLCDSGCEFEGLKIWGSPWTRKFEGQNPKAMAFALDTEKELAEKFELTPEDTDIMVTHSPPYGILDAGREEFLGSTALNRVVLSGLMLPQLKFHVFGHIHKWGGKRLDLTLTTFINAAIMNEQYEAVNKPTRIEL